MYEATLANVQSVRPHLGHISENGGANTDVRDVTWGDVNLSTKFKTR